MRSGSPRRSRRKSSVPFRQKQVVGDLRNLLGFRSRPAPKATRFRSSFRDWAAERTDAPHAVMEAALAHAVHAAYARSDLFERRRVLMEQWAEYLAGRGAGTKGLIQPVHEAAAPATGLGGRFRTSQGHFGESAGRRIASDARSPVAEGYGGRAESGGAAQGRGHRQGVTGPPSSSPSVRLTTERRRSLPATARRALFRAPPGQALRRRPQGLPRVNTRGWRGGGSAPPFEPPFEAELGARFAGGRRMSMPVRRMRALPPAAESLGRLTLVRETSVGCGRAVRIAPRRPRCRRTSRRRRPRRRRVGRERPRATAAARCRGWSGSAS